MHRCWFQMPTGLATVGELAGAICEEFGLSVSGAGGLQMIMDGFALLPGSAVSLIRDGDLVKVQRAPSQWPAGQAAVGAAQKQPPAKPATKPVLALAGPPAAGGAQASCKRKAAAPAQQSRPTKKPAAAVAAPAEPSSSEEESSDASSSAESASTEDSSSSGEDDQGSQPAAVLAAAAAAATKRPSRNARRKAIKRRLRREGVLPGGPRPAANGAATGTAQAAAVKAPVTQGAAGRAAAPVSVVSQPAAAADAPAAASGPGLQLSPRLPADRQQQPRAHIQFSDSDAEDAVHEQTDAAAASMPAAVMPTAVTPSGTAQQQVDRRHGDAGYNSQPWDYSRQQQRKQKRAGQRHTASAIALQPAQADDRLRPLPLVDENRLQPLTGQPQVGDVLSYRLLEIGADFSPQVSARRQGKVTTFDASSRQISMAPWPRPGIHPVWAERAQAAGVDYYEYTDAMEEGGEELPTEYDADGSLAIGYDSLADVAAITVTVSFDSPTAQRSPAPSAAAAAATSAQAPQPPQQNGAHGFSGGLHTPGGGGRQPNGSELPAAAAALRSPPPRPGAPATAAGMSRARAQSETRLAVATPPPHSGSGLGPPRPASTGPPPRPAAGRTVPSLSQWADVSRQLQRRRAELAAASNGGPVTPPAAVNGPALSPAAAVAAKLTAPPAALPSPAAGPTAATAAAGGSGSGAQEQGRPKQAPGVNGLPGKMTAGPARPHGGVRSSAMGAILRRLRSESEPAHNDTQL